IQIDGLFSPKVLDQVLEQFPPEDARPTWNFSNAALKMASNLPMHWGENIVRMVTYLNSPTFLQFLEEMTGIEGLIPDPYLEGGGLHMIKPGGSLAIHADFNWHKRLKLDRRLNLLLYLNKDWDESFGGALELWSQDMKAVVKKIY